MFFIYHIGLICTTAPYASTSLELEVFVEQKLFQLPLKYRSQTHSTQLIIHTTLPSYRHTTTPIKSNFPLSLYSTILLIVSITQISLRPQHISNRDIPGQDPIARHHRFMGKPRRVAVGIRLVGGDRGDVLDAAAVVGVLVCGVCVLPEPPDAVDVL